MMTGFYNSVVAYPIWDRIFLDNSIGKYTVALLVLIGLLIIFKIFRELVIRRLEKLATHTKTDIDDTIIGAIETLRPSFYFFIALYLAIKLLSVNHLIQRMFDVVLIVWVTFQAIQAIHVVLDHLFKKRVESGDPGAGGMIDFMNKLVKASLWLIGILLILSNLGLNISSLIAGLGIGGIAIALALQNILGDLFSSFAIYLDKPFQVGDYIVVGTERGHVEKIGIKTTRIRSLTGEQIIISNKELTAARIQNYKRMEERRKTFSFGVIYETPQEKLERIPEIIENIINNVDLAKFDRIFFSEFGDSALMFETTYYTKSRRFQDFAQTHHHILLAINKKFSEEGISMAYPTRTVYVHKD
jgi:small-conductance mechanosensitive channel